jgi:Bacterial Ig domain/Putative binding domain, N-terminal
MRQAISPRGRIRRWTLALACVLAPAVAHAVDPFQAPVQTSGTVAVKLYPTEGVATGVARRVTFGVPFTRGSLTTANVAKVRVLKGGVEIPAYVHAIAPWRHVSNPAIDGQSVRVVRIQINYTFAAAYPASETITVEWGLTPRTQDVPTFVDPRTAWHLVNAGSFVAADNVYEPDVYAVLPPSVLSQGVLRPGRALPVDPSVTEARSNPSVMDATEHWPGFREQEHAAKNNFYSVINEDDPAVTPANRCPYKTDSESWLYDRPATMFVLYMRTGFLKPLREAVRNAQFYKDRLWPDTTTPARAIGLFKLKTPDPTTWAGGNGAMYSTNESLAYTYWLTGDDAVLPHIRWVVTAHETNDEPTRWTPSLVTWTERHTAFRLLANTIGYEVFGDAAYRANVISQSDDFIWHQNGAGGQLPAGRVDGGLYHDGAQHGDGDGLVASSWMSALTVDAMVRAYAVRETASIAQFVLRMGNFERVATKVDSIHAYDTYEGSLAYPDYMMAVDGSSNERDGSEVEHGLDTAVTVAWAAYFGELLGTPDPSLVPLVDSLYDTYDIGVNYWIRPTGPPAGNTAFRVSPWRKWGWEHRISASLSWLGGQLGMGAPTPTVSLTNPASGATFVAPATIALAATASAPGDSVTRVEFYQGTTKLGEDPTSPYAFSWTGVGAGSYSLTAKVIAGSGTSATSSPVSVTVQTSGCGVSTPSSIYNQGFTAQSGSFTAIVDATPRAVGGTLLDTGVGLNSNPPVGETNSFHTAATVRFNTANGHIEARSGASYPATSLNWSAGLTYRVRFVVNVAGHTYNAYVTAPGGTEQTIGTGLAFRSNYASATSLNNLRGAVDGGSIEICPVSLPGPPSCTPQIAPGSASFTAAAGMGTVTVTVGAGCAWTAASNAAWVSITSGASGTGSGTVSYSVAANGSATARSGTLTIAGQTFTVSQSGASGGASVVDVYVDQQNVTFTSGTPGVQAAIVAGEGVGGSYAIKHTSLDQWGSSKRLHFAAPIDITQVLSTDKLRISLDLSAGGPADNSIYVFFNDNWQVYVVALAINSTPGYQTYTLDLGAVRSQLGNAINDIYFKAGNGFPVGGTLWVDEMRFIRP